MGLAAIAHQDLRGRKKPPGEVLSPLDHFRPPRGGCLQEAGGRSSENARAAVKFRIDQVDRDLAGQPVCAHQDQCQDQHDRHHGDERIGHDEPVAQAPDQLLDSLSGQAYGHYHARDPGGKGGYQPDERGRHRVGQHHGQNHQQDERLFDEPELAVEGFQACAHSHLS